MTRLAVIFARPAQTLMVLAMLCSGCGRGDQPSIENFERAWHDAISQRRYDDLYALLDSSSQRWIESHLERMRGFTPEQQQQVIDWLGGERVEDLTHLKPSQFFGRLWEKITLGARPTMRVDLQGENWAYMTLGLGEGREQRFRLVVEAGRWVWQVPEQGPPRDVPARPVP